MITFINVCEHIQFSVSDESIVADNIVLNCFFPGNSWHQAALECNAIERFQDSFGDKYHNWLIINNDLIYTIDLSYFGIADGINPTIFDQTFVFKCCSDPYSNGTTLKLFKQQTFALYNDLNYLQNLLISLLNEEKFELCCIIRDRIAMLLK